MKKGAFLVGLMFLLLCAILLISTVLAHAVDENARQKLYPRLKPPIVLIVFKFRGEARYKSESYNVERITTGTGFIITPDGYLITNGHVVEGYYDSNTEDKIRQLTRDRMPIKLRRNLAVAIKRDVTVILSNGTEYPAEIKRYSPPMQLATGTTSIMTYDDEKKVESGKDVAILKIEGRNFPTVQLGNSDNVQGGDPVYIAGFPGPVLHEAVLSKKTIFDPTVNQGSISGKKQILQGSSIIQTDTAITHGNSGGPAFNSKGEVVGIATLGSSGQNGQEIHGFNFLVPINTAKEFIRASGAELNQESLFNKYWFLALEAYSNSDSLTARNMADEANRIVPNIPGVKNLLEAIGPISQSRPFPKTALILGVLGIAIIGGAIFFIFRSKEKKPSAPSSAPSSAPTVAVSPKTKISIPAMLKCTDGPLAGRTFPITASGVKIGRDPIKNQIAIDNDEISREHASVSVENGKVVIKDLNSLNGTFIGSTDTDRIKSEVLKNGDVIIIGKGKFASFTFSEG